MEKKRSTAIKTRINSLSNGKYVVQGEFNPNYVVTDMGQRISRARVLATVVDKFMPETKSFASITLDDATDTVRAKVFGSVSIFDMLEKGDIVDVIGKVKEYQDEVFLMPETVVKHADPNIIILRELELRKYDRKWNEKIEKISEMQKEVSDVMELKRLMKERYNIEEDVVESILSIDKKEIVHKEKEEILKLIESSEQGCDYSELIEKSGFTEEVIDKAVQDLLEEGVCFEPKAGRIRKL